ncbi:MAG: hypothetical protein KJZ85_15505 [Rhodobacteraceae bacterium]|jgi:hypothetical protein|nr:hypothetical protein [Paracoccaceae bacterium]
MATRDHKQAAPRPEIPAPGRQMSGSEPARGEEPAQQGATPAADRPAPQQGAPFGDWAAI